ncbi:MAG TPA: hypothetical protein VFS21_03005 [Roseiflexaceae bacterium]|nr:hypothetical protein [Roseiflexaceae bacterium]
MNHPQDTPTSEHQIGAPQDMVAVGAVLPVVAEDLREIVAERRSSPRPSRRVPSATSRPVANSSSSSNSACRACSGAGTCLATAQEVAEERLIAIERYSERLVLVFCGCEAGRNAARAWNRLPSEAQGWTLSGLRMIPDQDEAVEAIEAFIARPLGWVTLVGKWGVGKSTLMYIALNELLARGIYGQYWTMPNLLDYLRDAYNAKNEDSAMHRLRKIAELPLLVIDELDKYNATEWAGEQVQKLFDARYRERRQVGTIIGYNTDGEAKIPGFITSRMEDGRFRHIRMRGCDLRPAMEDEPVGNDPRAVWDRGGA